MYNIMPIKVRKVRGKSCFQVKDMKTGKVHSKCTTKSKAEAQAKLIRAIDHGFIPTKK